MTQIGRPITGGGGGSPSVHTVVIVGYGTGQHGHFNSSFRCKELDSDGNPIDPTFDVLAWSLPQPGFPFFGGLNLSDHCTPFYLIGDVIRIQPQNNRLQVAGTIPTLTKLWAVDTFFLNCDPK